MRADNVLQKKLTNKERGRRNEALVPVELLRELFEYDPETGAVTAKRNRRGSKVKQGEAVGCLSTGKTTRYLVMVDKKLLKLHRVVWALYYGEWPKDEIDHIDGNSTNNKTDNLRSVSRQENMRNRRLSRNNTSGFIGVSLTKEKNKYRARIWDNGKEVVVGYFDTAEQASLAYEAAKRALNYHPNHGRDAPIKK